MKKKINHELTPRESRLAEEAVGIKRDKTGKFATKASYPDVERKLKRCVADNRQLRNELSSEKALNVKAMKQIQKDKQTVTIFIYIFLFLTFVLFIANVTGNMWNSINDHIINSVTQTNYD